MVINNSYGPLLNSLPLSLAHRSYGMKKTEENSQGTFEEEEQGFGGDRDTTTTARKRASAGKEPIVLTTNECSVAQQWDSMC